MDKKFLDKVIDQLVRETKIIDDRVYTPFFSSFPSLFSPSSSFYLYYFSFHCKEIYGLNEQEIEYAWYMYENIIKDKIESNGL